MYTSVSYLNPAAHEVENELVTLSGGLLDLAVYVSACKGSWHLQLSKPLPQLGLKLLICSCSALLQLRRRGLQTSSSTALLGISATFRARMIGEWLLVLSPRCRGQRIQFIAASLH